jgi:hypothetical protein
MIKLRFIEKIPPVLRNKYILTLVIFLIWILLLDSNNLISRYKEMKVLRKLKADKEYYTKRIEEDKRKLQNCALITGTWKSLHGNNTR